MHDHIRPGCRVLFAGLGQGGDAVAAAERGGRVTVVDISADRLAAFSGRIRARAFLHPPELVRGDIFTFEDARGYDLVFASFFLEHFPRIMMVPLMEHLAGLLNEEGRLVVADFAPPAGWLPERVLAYAHWYCTDIFHHLVSRAAVHPIHDCQETLTRLGFTIEERKYYRFLFIKRYQAILAARP